MILNGTSQNRERIKVKNHPPKYELLLGLPSWAICQSYTTTSWLSSDGQGVSGYIVPERSRRKCGAVFSGLLKADWTIPCFDIGQAVDSLIPQWDVLDDFVEQSMIWSLVYLLCYSMSLGETLLNSFVRKIYCAKRNYQQMSQCFLKMKVWKKKRQSVSCWTLKIQLHTPQAYIASENHRTNKRLIKSCLF